jgi:hypothetical protein
LKNNKRSYLDLTIRYEERKSGVRYIQLCRTQMLIQLIDKEYIMYEYTFRELYLVGKFPCFL